MIHSLYTSSRNFASNLVNYSSEICTDSIKRIKNAVSKIFSHPYVHHTLGFVEFKYLEFIDIPMYRFSFLFIGVENHLLSPFVSSSLFYKIFSILLFYSFLILVSVIIALLTFKISMLIKISTLPLALFYLSQMYIYNLLINFLEIKLVWGIENKSISHFKLTHLPESIGNLQNLTSLEIGSNDHLAYIPESIGNLQNLNVLHIIGNDSLAYIPESIGNLQNLNVLHIIGNDSLAYLPESIGNLQNLTSLDLSFLPSLRGLPNSILNLPPTCTVYLTGTPLAPEILRRLQRATEEPNYRGPRFSFSMTFAQGSFGSKSLNEYLEVILRSIQKTDTTFTFINHLEESKKEKLRQWLEKLEYPNAHKNTDCPLYQALFNIFTLADKEESFRGVFLQILEEATETCPDRASLYLLQMGIMREKMALQDKSAPQVWDVLRQCWIIDLLTTCARNKIPHLKFFDEIEVYLGYPVKLKEALGLSLLDGISMLFFGCSGLTQKDLDTAKEFVDATIKNEENRINYLLKQKEWLEFLEKNYPREYDEAQALKEAYKNNSNDEGYTQAETILKKITKQALGTIVSA